MGRCTGGTWICGRDCRDVCIRVPRCGVRRRDCSRLGGGPKKINFSSIDSVALRALPQNKKILLATSARHTYLCRGGAEIRCSHTKLTFGSPRDASHTSRSSQKQRVTNKSYQSHTHMHKDVTIRALAHPLWCQHAARHRNHKDTAANPP